MHFSRMHIICCTGRWRLVYPSMHWAGGCVCLGVSALRGVCPGGMCARGVSAAPPCEQNNRRL